MQLKNLDLQVVEDELHSWLTALTTLHCNHHSLESTLQNASRLAVDLLNLEHCSIGWFDQKDVAIRVRTSYTKKGAQVDPNRAVDAISKFVKKKRPKHLGRGQSVCDLEPPVRRSGHALELIAPLRLHKQIIGYLYGFKSQLSKPGFIDTDKSLFFGLSQHISAAIEAQLTREMLDCPYVALLANSQQKTSPANLDPMEWRFLNSVKNPELLARKIAQRFFGDLHRANFETKHIILILAELTGSLNEALRGAKS